MNAARGATVSLSARADQAALLVVDLQEKLFPSIHEQARVLAASEKMIRAVRLLDLPILVTEQYPAGLGPTLAPIARALGEGERIDKLTFSACGAAAVCSRLKEMRRLQVLVVGIEAHVCVQQTALDLLESGYAPFVLADAVGSRRPFEYDIALRRMSASGVVVTTTESMIFELCRQAGTPRFKELLPLIK